MRETKDQKIKRLEKAIEEQKQELTEVKKDRKRLNYTVERLEREKEKLSLQSSKKDIVTIKDLEKQTEVLTLAIEEKKREIKNLKSDSYKQRKEIYQLRNDLRSKIIMSENEAMKKVVEKLCKIKKESNEEQLQYFQNGDRYFDYSFKDYPESHIQCSIFSTKNLIIQIHPKNGRDLIGLDIFYITKTIGNRLEYLEAMHKFEQFKKSNPSNDELVEWVYKKGMELLPIYENEIF